ncbi:phage GP46 family protein [Desulfocurvus vexinensis]|uniref:phage GP46 family protein n=1 Tax=Desulfocurvus vexinensis TaxID=399548 RepID=UPI00048C6FF3|nr:phage GP46 family protein [Desulfocurvus vexinensis]
MDAALVWTDTGGDLQVLGGDLLAEESLATAVVLSLFLDRRALPEDELPHGGTDRRGWWADAFGDADLTGSRLWLLWRRKQLPEVLAEAREYAEEALGWLVEDGVATSVSVATSFPRRGMLQWNIRITRTSGSESTYSFTRALEG